MTRSIKVPLSPDTKHIAFAPVCVRCGAPSDAVTTVKVRKENPAREVTLDVPYCATCKPITERLASAGWIVAFIAGLIAAAGVFVVLLGAMDQVERFLGGFMPSTQVAAFSLIGMSSLLIGAVLGILFESVSRVILLPFGGDPLNDPPPIAVDLFQPGVAIRGLRASIDWPSNTLRMVFSRDDTAEASASLTQHSGPRKKRPAR